MTMKQARKAFAGRTMVSPAFTDKESGKRVPRKNQRDPAGASFRVWARENIHGVRLDGPKLARVLGGGAS